MKIRHFLSSQLVVFWLPSSLICLLNSGWFFQLHAIYIVEEDLLIRPKESLRTEQNADRIYHQVTGIFVLVASAWQVINTVITIIIIIIIVIIIIVITIIGLPITKDVQFSSNNNLLLIVWTHTNSFNFIKDLSQNGSAHFCKVVTS